jgi:protein-tyrosine-phosphatase
VLLVDPAHARRLRREIGPHDRPVIVLGDLDPQSVNARTIRDPWGQDPDVFERVFDRLDRCLDMLVDGFRAEDPR